MSEPRPEPSSAMTSATSAAAAGEGRCLLGHVFRRPELLDRALVHRSAAYERGGDGASYERLEFLGDAVLGLLSAEWLYRRFPERSEGELTQLKGFLVSAPVLGRHAAAHGLGDLVRLGVGEERSGGRAKVSILADALEAVFAAIYLDAGLEAARAVVEPFLESALEARGQIPAPTSKTDLQELLQAAGRPLPEYRVVAEAGPDHDKTFTVELWIGGEAVATATGTSKKSAEKAAAAAALAAMAAAGPC